jgi:hypothetical protein
MPNTSTKKIVEKESGGDDAFARAAKAEPAPLKSRYISSGTVEIGEGVKFAIDALEIVEDRFESDGSKVAEIRATVVESRAAGVIDDGEITITCKSLRLEQLANELGLYEIPGAVVTLLRSEDVGKRVEWHWVIEGPPS